MLWGGLSQTWYETYTFRLCKVWTRTKYHSQQYLTGFCHNLFPELSPIHSPPPCLFWFTPSSSLRTPHAMLIGPDHTWPGPMGLSPSHPNSWPEPWSECNPTALGMWTPSEVMCPSHDDCATMHHPGHLISRPPSWWTWDLRVPTLFLSNLFSSYCVLMLLWLLSSGCAHTCSHSLLRGQLYVPLCPVCIPVSFIPMQTAAAVTDTFWPPSQ